MEKLKNISELSSQEKSILAAESIGWEVPRSADGHLYYSTYPVEGVLGYPPPDKNGNRFKGHFLTIPIVDSLDAMRMYEKHLTEKECYIYEATIAKLQDSNDAGWFSQKCIFASLEHRLAAFLFTKGKVKIS